MDKILKASYGDQQQREINAKGAASRAAQAAEIQARHERRAFRPELPTPPSGNGPLFWDPKAQGAPYGLYNANRAAPKGVKVEIRPGVFHVVEEPPGGRAGARGAPEAARGAAGAGAGAAAAGGGRPRRPISAPPRMRPGAGGGAGGGVVDRRTVEVLPEVAVLEGRMREALRRSAAVHIKERTVLLQVFAAVLGKRHTELGPPDKVTPEQFIAVWKRFGLVLTPQLAAAFFDKYGRDARGLMPVMVFTDALVMGAPRLDMAANDVVQRGAYVAGKSASHMGKILYPECKKGVWPPSNWDPRLAERSATLPDVRLALEFVHGYDGHLATSPNIFYLATGEIVYHAAAVGVVYNKAQHTQRFFLGHDDDILCTAVHPDRTTVATGQLGRQPCVLVWDGPSQKLLSRLKFDRDDRGIQALAFSPDGTRLACIATDNSHSLHIVDWARRQRLCEPRKSQPGAPPAVYGVVWSKYEPDRLVTYGQNHIKFWRVGPDPRGPAGSLNPTSESGIYALGKTHSVLSAAFLPSGIVLTGNAKGCICSWRGNRLTRETQAHATGPPTRRPDGKQSYGGVRCLVLQTDRVLLSGGADGVVRMWDVSGGDLGAMLRQLPLLRPDQVGTTAPPALRGLDCAPDNPEMFVAGVASCDVWEVDKDPEVLVYGQQADLYGLATNAAFPHVYATCCDSDKVTVWSAATRKPIRIVSLGGLVARSCAFSVDGQQLAVGCANGGIQVLEFHPSVRQVWWGKTFNSSVDDLKFSPCGRYLAAGSHDQAIDVFDVTRGYARVCRCVGHSSTVRHLDWAADSGAIQSVDQAYEILYFDPRTGKQLKDNQRDTAWSGWSCLLGFPVMGIWFPDSDGTDINSVHASPSGRYVLTADDLGRVRLLNFPCVVQAAPAHVYCGHSSHVMNVRWAADESYAVSVGGKDRAVFQWRVVRQAVQQQQPLATPWAQLDNAGLMWGAPPPPQQQQQQHQVSPQQQYAQPYQQQQGMPVGQSPNRGPQGQVIGIGARAAAGAGAGRRAVSASPARGVGMGPAASPGQFAGQQRRR